MATNLRGTAVAWTLGDDTDGGDGSSSNVARGGAGGGGGGGAAAADLGRTQVNQGAAGGISFDVTFDEPKVRQREEPRQTSAPFGGRLPTPRAHRGLARRRPHQRRAAVAPPRQLRPTQRMRWARRSLFPRSCLARAPLSNKV